METTSEKLTKEVYAYFGRAYFFSECLYRELCNGWVLSQLNAMQGATWPRIDELFSRAYKLTFGLVLDQLADQLPRDLVDKLKQCLDRRNYLAHHFWFDRVNQMATDDGLASLRDELEEMADQFAAVDEELTAFFEPVGRSVGVTPELVAQTLVELLAGEDAPLLDRRMPKKQETVVGVWDVPVKTGGLTLIFQTDDGEFWQLCDVGLGWCTHEAVASDWRENVLLKEYLPMVLNPRPRDARPWDYALLLRGGAALWVKKVDPQGPYQWGIR
jgi:hypothetical protein